MVEERHLRLDSPVKETTALFYVGTQCRFASAPDFPSLGLEYPAWKEVQIERAPARAGAAFCKEGILIDSLASLVVVLVSRNGVGDFLANPTSVW